MSKAKINKKFSEEHKQNLSKSLKGKYIGKDSPAWKGGVSTLKFKKGYGIGMDEWKEIAKRIRNKNNYICQRCGRKRSTIVHHIIPRRIAIDNSENNLITLCRTCHLKLEHLTNKYIEKGKDPYEIFYGKTKKDLSLHTYVIDIDNTILSQEKDYSRAKPLQNRIDYFNKLYDEGHRIIYWTARGYDTGIDWREITLKQFEDFDIKFHSLRFDKIDASFYIDDKCINVSDLNL